MPSRCGRLPSSWSFLSRTVLVPVLATLLLLDGALGEVQTRPAGEQPQPRPNIILIMAEDLSAGLTGFEGHPLVRTPALDQLARGSVFFARCYTPTPQSDPSVATVLTGQYPRAHGVTTDGENLSLTVDTFTGRLAAEGYACGFAGEWNISDKATAESGFGLTLLTGEQNRRDEAPPSTTRRADQDTTDVATSQVDQALAFVDRAKSDPFFLWLRLGAPGDADGYPPGLQAEYPPEKVPLPQTMTVDEKTQPDKVKQSPAAQRFREWGHDQQALREARSKHFARVAHVDSQIGRLLQEIEKRGLRENTIVIFTSDHGTAIGEHGLIGEGPTFYDETARVPLLVRWPGQARAGGRVERVVSLVDLAPTVCAMVDIRPPILMNGHSLAPMLRDPESASSPDERFLEFHRQPEHRSSAPSAVVPGQVPPSGRTAHRHPAVPVQLPGRPLPPQPGADTTAGVVHRLPGVNPAQPSDRRGNRPIPVSAPASNPSNSPDELEDSLAPGLAILLPSPTTAEAPGDEDSAVVPQPEPMRYYEFPVQGIVTHQYKFIDYLDGRTTVLFDLKRDPNEITNLAGDLFYAQVVDVLRKRLEIWRTE
ncbi:MAG: hypothetical protein AMXMBFR13_18970 [Phycisphaerae bacterium]